MSDLLPGIRPDETASDPTTEVVQLTGDYDIATAADLRHALTDDTSAPVVIADFHDVTFVDSSALRALLEVRQHLEDEARSLELANLPDQLSTLLRITDTQRLFHLA
jgi:anti-anti-sigma factor